MAAGYFDCNCMLGKRADRRPHEPWSVAALTASMADSGIAEALVTHAQGRDVDPAFGNDTLAREIAGREGLHGCWSILPPVTGELRPPGEFIAEMFERNIRATVAYPHLHNYSLSDWSIDPLCMALEKHRIPLLLPFGQASWEEVEQLCRRHPHLPIVITGVNYRQLRYLLPLWDRYRNLFVDLSWFSIHNGLSFLSARGLIPQVLFGTNYPLYEPGAAVAMVTYAGITEEERAIVAGGTMRSILHGMRREAK